MDTGSPGAAFTVATTVASLGAGTDGKAGIIRAGGTGGIADSWKQVIYDATYAKWMVSAPDQGDGFSANPTATTYDGTLYASWLTIWKVFDTAGLTPQLKVIGQIGGSSSGITVTWRTAYFGANDGDDVYPAGRPAATTAGDDVGAVVSTPRALFP